MDQLTQCTDGYKGYFVDAYSTGKDLPLFCAECIIHMLKKITVNFIKLKCKKRKLFRKGCHPSKKNIKKSQ